MLKRDGQRRSLGKKEITQDGSKAGLDQAWMERMVSWGWVLLAGLQVTSYCWKCEGTESSACTGLADTVQTPSNSSCLQDTVPLHCLMPLCTRSQGLVKSRSISALCPSPRTHLCPRFCPPESPHFPSMHHPSALLLGPTTEFCWLVSGLLCPPGSEALTLARWAGTKVCFWGPQLGLHEDDSELKRTESRAS